MRIFRRQLIYVQVHQDHFIARVVGGDRAICRQCHALGNRAGPIKDFSVFRPQLKDIFSEITPRFSLEKPWAILHFDPIEYTKASFGALVILGASSSISLKADGSVVAQFKR